MESCFQDGVGSVSSFSRGWGGSQPSDRCPPCPPPAPPKFPASEIKQTFCQPGLFVGFWVANSPIPHTNNRIPQAFSLWRENLLTRAGCPLRHLEGPFWGQELRKLQEDSIFYFNLKIGPFRGLWCLFSADCKLSLVVVRGGLLFLAVHRAVTPRHVESSQTRDRTCVPCIGRQIRNHQGSPSNAIWFYLLRFWKNNWVLYGELWGCLGPDQGRTLLAVSLLQNFDFTQRDPDWGPLLFITTASFSGG